MKTYLYVVCSPLIFLFGNLFVAIMKTTTFIAKGIEKVSHAVVKACNGYTFAAMKDIIDDAVEHHNK